MLDKIIFSAPYKDKIEDFINEGLGEYLFSFNPLKRKYSFLEFGLPLGTLEKIREFEFSQSYSNLTKSKYSHISDNLELVYGDTSITKKDIITYHEATKKIIHEFLGIQNLDRLFDEDYFDFEWDILAQKNFTEHRQGYQREHFIHQIRNLYMGDKLLEELDFYDATKAVLSDRNGSKISKYTYKKFIQFKNDEYSPISQLISKIAPYFEDEILNPSSDRAKKMFTPSKEDVLTVFGQIIDSSEFDGIIDSTIAMCYKHNLQSYIINCDDKAKDWNWHKAISDFKPHCHLLRNNLCAYFNKHYICKWYTEEYFYNYVIYASLYLSCLFHDLSYPVCYFLEFRHRLSSYSAASYMFTHNSMESFDTLANKLSNSLLFTIVSYQEIKDRMEYKNHKYDHGVYSAIAFLLHFYESGLINSLSFEKQCAIELAAVAMYDHTLSFDCEKIDKKNLHYSPYFNQNPIALILRLCDDLQEWDRRYFEFTGDSDLIFCPKCKTPMLKHRYQDDNLSNTKTYKYKCFCGSQGTNPYRSEEFLKRKIFVVRIADRLIAQKISKSNESSEKLIKFTVDYDLYKLLLMSRYSYAKYRLEDLNKLKTKLKYQNYVEQSGVKDTPTAIFVDYFMTSNPITIKVKILEKWLFSKKQNELFKTPITTHVRKKDIDYSVFKNFEKLQIRSEIRNDIDTIFRLPQQYLSSILGSMLHLDEISNKNSKNDFCTHLWWYYLVYQGSLYFRENSEIIKHSGAYADILDDVTLMLINSLPASTVRSNRTFDKQSYEEYTKMLVKDCLKQYSKEMVSSNDYNDVIKFMDQGDYTEQYSSNDMVYDAITKYCYQETYCNGADSFFRPDFNDYNCNNLPINYFSDLYIFEKMNEEIRKSQEK